MDVHQTEFLQAVVLAGAVALGMTVWDKGQERVHAAGTPKAEARKDQVRLGALVTARTAIAPARDTRVSRDPTAQQ